MKPCKTSFTSHPALLFPFLCSFVDCNTSYTRFYCLCCPFVEADSGRFGDLGAINRQKRDIGLNDASFLCEPRMVAKSISITIYAKTVITT